MGDKYPVKRWLVQSDDHTDMLAKSESEAMLIMTRRRNRGVDTRITSCRVPGPGEPLERLSKTRTYKAPKGNR